KRIADIYGCDPTLAVYEINTLKYVLESRTLYGNPAIPNRTDGGTLAQTAIQRLSIIIDSGASADNCLVALIHIPGEPEGRLEIQVIVLSGAQVAAVNRRQVSGLGEIVVHQLTLENPTQAIVYGEVRPDSPAILRIEMIPVVLLGVIDVIGRWLNGIAYPYSR